MHIRTALVALVSLPALAWAQMSDPVVVTGLPVLEPLPAPLELQVEPAQRQRLTISDSGEVAGQDDLALRSAAALVISQDDGQLLYAKNTDAVMPIASITKLMTAMVILDYGLDLDEEVVLTKEDAVRMKGSRSRLRTGLKLTRGDLLLLALMASDNRAAAALGGSYPGGLEAIVDAMNVKAAVLDMEETRFVEPTGLSPANVSTAADLAKLVRAAHEYPLIREYSTKTRATVRASGRPLSYGNTNNLVRSKYWDIELSKTGYISEAGRCLVMHVRLAEKDLIVVLLDSWGKHSRIGDANRIRKWLESGATRGRSS
jgi:D-alanyl-D-alanine endopeptidase (penicillin-binding protein 7)